MTARYQPTVVVDERPLTATSVGDDVVPLASIVLRWGRTDLFAPTPPSTITVTVLDRDGSWGTRDGLVGRELAVELPDRSLFRGSVGEVSVGPIDVTVDGTSREVYEVELTGTCRLADLDMAILPGPGSHQEVDSARNARNGVLGVDHWPSWGAASTRRDDILAAGGLRYVDAIESPTRATSGLPAEGLTTTIHAFKFSEQLSLLELIEHLYGHQPLGHVNYDPTTNSVGIGRPAASVGLALVMDGPTITLQPAGGHALSATDLQTSSRPRITSTVLNSIDAVLAEWQYDHNAIYGDAAGGYYEDPAKPTQRHSLTVRTSNGRGEKTLLIKTPFVNAAAATAVASIAASMIDGVNNQFAMPPVTYDFRRSTSADPALDALLLDTRTHDAPLYLVGSQFNHLDNVGPMFQIIGGTLRWHPATPGSGLDAGWTHELTLAPTVGITAALTLAELVTNPTPTLADFHESITLADLGHVTIGAQ